MGWDAYSSVEVDYENNRIKDDKLNDIFLEAFKFVVEKTGSADGSLRFGGLDCSLCGEMLERATSRSVYQEGWGIIDSFDNTYLVNWDFKYKKEDAWAYWSARKFLECCIENKLSIKFDW